MPQLGAQLCSPCHEVRYSIDECECASAGFGPEPRTEPSSWNVGMTPWGEAQPEGNKEIAAGVTQVSTASHGGLRFSPERWASLPSEVRETFMHPGWAEEDCEAPIAMAVLGIGGERQSEYEAIALRMADEFDTYAACAPHITSSESSAVATHEIPIPKMGAVSRQAPRCGHPMPIAKRLCSKPAGHIGAHR